MNDEPELLLETLGRVGLITINKPRALNALSMNMIELMHPQLLAWAKDDAIDAVVVHGA